VFWAATLLSRRRAFFAKFAHPGVWSRRSHSVGKGPRGSGEVISSASTHLAGPDPGLAARLRAIRADLPTRSAAVARRVPAEARDRERGGAVTRRVRVFFRRRDQRPTHARPGTDPAPPEGPRHVARKHGSTCDQRRCSPTAAADTGQRGLGGVVVGPGALIRGRRTRRSRTGAGCHGRPGRVHRAALVRLRPVPGQGLRPASPMRTLSGFLESAAECEDALP
jgi:hypothetical protein